MFKTGELIQGKKSGILFEVIRGAYTTRFMDPQIDQEMIECGMAHMAGTYGSAVDVIILSGRNIGKTIRKQKLSKFSRTSNG